MTIEARSAGNIPKSLNGFYQSPDQLVRSQVIVLSTLMGTVRLH